MYLPDREGVWGRAATLGGFGELFWGRWNQWRIQPNETALEAAGTWTVYLDGSDVNLNSSDGGDIEAIALNPQGDLHFSTRGEVALEDNSGGELTGNGASVLGFRPSSLGLTTSGAVGDVIFDGTTSGLTSQAVDAIALETFVDLDNLDSALNAQIDLLLGLRPSADPDPDASGDEEHLFFSLGDTATIDGIEYQDEDIIAFDGQEFKIYFDGSNVDVAGDIDAFDIINDSEVLLSFNTPVTIKIDGTDTEIDDSDIVKFTGRDMGFATNGSFEMFFDGSEYGLTDDLEDIDSIQLLNDNSLLISTIGTSDIVPDLTTGDEDILRVQPNFNSSQTWSLYFDGSNAELGGQDSEDITGMSLNAAGQLNLTTIGEFGITDDTGNELTGNDLSVFQFNPTSLGEETDGNYSSDLVFNGADFGLVAQNIDGLSLESLVDFDALGADYIDLTTLGASEFIGNNPDANSEDAIFFSL